MEGGHEAMHESQEQLIDIQERRIEELEALVANLQDYVGITNLRNDMLVADMERLKPWIALLKDAPEAHRKSIQERYLAAELIGRREQAWKDRVAQHEQCIKELEHDLRVTQEALISAQLRNHELEAEVECLRNQLALGASAQGEYDGDGT
jgi:chromosome segregation ATPase